MSKKNPHFYPPSYWENINAAKEKDPDTPVRSVFETPPAGEVRGLDSLFASRQFFKKDIYKDFIFGERNLIDFWNSQNLYGRVDKDGFPIIPNVADLKDFASVDPDAPYIPSAIHFVVDAFEDFADYMLESADTSLGIIDTENSIIYPLKARAAWTSAFEDYNNYLSNVVFPGFANFFATSNQHNGSIVDFQSFVDLFMKYLTLICGEQMPFTYTGFAKSPLYTMMHSGLVISLVPDQGGADEGKFLYWMADPNFEFYRRKAETFGFFVDKNIPWRLVANLNHPYMKKKQKMNGFFGQKNNLNQIFNFAFTRTWTQDIAALRTHFAGMYGAFKTTFGTSRVPRSKVCEKSGKIKTHVTITELPEIGPDTYLPDGTINTHGGYYQKYGYYFWIKVYYYIRSLEEHQPISHQQLDKKIKSYYVNYRNRGWNSTIMKINRDLASQNQPLSQYRV